MYQLVFKEDFKYQCFVLVATKEALDLTLNVVNVDIAIIFLIKLIYIIQYCDDIIFGYILKYL